MLGLKSPNFILAIILLVATLVILGIVVITRIGGDNALYLIIGHLVAWVEIVVIFFFRKNPTKEVKS